MITHSLRLLTVIFPLMLTACTVGPDYRHPASGRACRARLIHARHAASQGARGAPYHWRFWRRPSAPDHPNVAVSLQNYAALLRKLNRTVEAEAMETQAKAIQAK